MKVLYVEDDQDFAQPFVQLLTARVPNVEITLVGTSDNARLALEADRFDVVLLDLAIPVNDDGTAHVENGSALFRLIEIHHSGAAVVIFTGQRDERETDELRDAAGRRVRFLGGTERPYLSTKRKDLPERVLDLFSQLAIDETAGSAVRLSDLDNRALDGACPEQDRRLLRAFCVFRSATRGRVRRLTGGLSGSAVYRLDVISDSGVVRQRCIAKLAGGDDFELEKANYHELVTLLSFGYPTQVSVDLIAGGARRAVFYNLAEEFDLELFASFDNPNTLIERVKFRLRNWHQDRHLARARVQDIVLEVGGERALQLVEGCGVPGIQNALQLEVEHFRAVQHGDLHGANVLCNAAGSDVCIIDFGDVRETVALLDVVTLELCPFFHPAAAGRADVLAIKAAQIDWFDDNGWSQSEEGVPWIVVMRGWARATAMTHLDYAATVLAYAARQLKYEGTDREMALRLIQSCVRELANH